MIHTNSPQLESSVSEDRSLPPVSEGEVVSVTRTSPVSFPAVPAPELGGLDPRSRDYVLDLYQRAVGTSALLTAAEELELARRVRAGDEAARERMIKSNLRLVIAIAHEYREYGLPLLDLINEGNVGLIRAVDRFDPERGARLATYAGFWIRQSIRKALSTQARTIRLPVGVSRRITLLNATAQRLETGLGRPASDEEVAEAIGVTVKEVRKWRLAGSPRTTSLEAPLGDDDSARLGDVLADESVERPGTSLDAVSRVDLLRELISTLPEREQRILRERFGLDGRRERTLEEIGTRFGLTRERIRQLEAAALRKLRQRLEARETVRLPAPDPRVRATA